MANRQFALVWAVCLVALTAGCKGCAGREEKSAEPPGDRVVAADDLVLRGSVIGQKDEANRYLSTVAFRNLSAPEGTSRRGCNGVLVASNLVLTAAHCVCAPSPGETSRLDGSKCAAQAQVRVDYWDPAFDGGSIPGWTDRIAGNISIHPRFQIVLDSEGGVLSSRADLAIIRLERPVPPEIAPVSLATEEVQVGEIVSVVGFGYDETGYISALLRWFSQEKIQAPAGEDRLLFGPMDQAGYKGDTGGPCLRETKRGFELVGISQRGLGQTPTFTRIIPYRDWLEEQIRGTSEK